MTHSGHTQSMARCRQWHRNSKHSDITCCAVLDIPRHLKGITPDKGDVLVTGAAGGVGSVAIALLDKLGYRVVASSRRAEQEGDYLQGLGADEIIDVCELSGAGNPLGKERWAGAIDSLGSRTLANGAVAACGLAQGPRPARDRNALHPTRRDACGRELGANPAREARRGLELTGKGPRPRQAQRHDVTGKA